MRHSGRIRFDAAVYVCGVNSACQSPVLSGSPVKLAGSSKAQAPKFPIYCIGNDGPKSGVTGGKSPERVARMGARFAGSQRLGDRRRRRLAVETDEISDGRFRTDTLPAPAGSERTIDGAHTDYPSPDIAPTSSSPVSRFIPFEWWKYLIGALSLLVISAGLLTVGWKAADLSPTLGPGFERLYAFPDAPAARWFSGLLLFVSAQVALFIWWARSQSHNDFDGRYWLWIRVACVWLIFSGCVATGAQEAFRETVLFFLPDISSRTANLAWLTPALALGLSIIAALAREMRDCRASRGLLWLAAGSYLCAAGLSLEVEYLLPQAVQPLLVQGCLSVGHVGLFLSMWWHARHVVHCTADPAMRPKSNWRIPRPHFRLLNFRLPQLGRKNQTGKGPQEAADPPISRRKRPAKKTTVEPESTAELDPTGSTAASRQQSESSGKPQFRVDDRHEVSSGRMPRAPSGTPVEVPAERIPARAPAAAPPARDAAAIEMPPRMNHTPAESLPDRNGQDAEPDESDEHSSKPDVRGLSKKQRRRMMQELRDRERASGR